MNAPTIWPASVRTVDVDSVSYASLYDLLSTRGLKSPRDAWSKLRRRCPHLAEVVGSAIITGHQATPVVHGTAWATLVAAMGDAASTTATRVGDAAPATLAKPLETNEATLATLNSDAAVDDGDAAPTVTATLPAKPLETNEATLATLPDGEADSDDAEDELAHRQSGYSRDELRMWSTEAESRRAIAEEHRARLALPPQTKAAPKKPSMTMEELVTRRMEARAQKEATARAAIAATPSEPEPDYVDDGKPITADDDDGYGTEDYDEGDDSDETDATPTWWRTAAE